MASWRIFYYPNNTYKEFFKQKYKTEKLPKTYILYLIRDCHLPNILFHYILLSLPMLAVSPELAKYYLINRLGAEIITAFHTFTIIVPNHTGEDLLLIKDHYNNKGEFYLAGILGTCNFKTGGFWNDYCHGYLNYQIEHHLFPQLSPLKLSLIQKDVQSLCKELDIPYIQESAFVRLVKCFHVFFKNKSMASYYFERQ